MLSRKRPASPINERAKRTAPDTDWQAYERQVVDLHRAGWPQLYVFPWFAVPDDALTACGWLNDFTAHMQCKAEHGKRAYYREFGLDALAVDSVNGPLTCAHLIQAKHRQSVGADDLGAFCTAVRMCASTQAQRGQPIPTRAVLYYSQRLTPGGQLSLQQLEAASVTAAATHVPFAACDGALMNVDRADALDTEAMVMRPYQLDAVAALGAWTDGVRVLDMPCGTGKTCVVLAHMRQTMQAAPTYVGLVVVPTLALAQQWHARLTADVLPHVRGATIIKLDCENERTAEQLGVHGTTHTLVVAVVNSVALMPECALDMIVVDEAHDMVVDAGALNDCVDSSDAGSEHDADNVDDDNESSDDDDESSDDDDGASTIQSSDETGRQWLRRQMDANVRTLLVSATPPRNYTVAYRYDRAQAIRDGHVCDYRVYQPLLAPADQDDPRAWIDAMYESRAEFLATAAERRGLQAVIVYVHRASHIPTFSVQMRAAVARHGRAMWISSITADTKGRQAILERFEHGNPADPTELRVLVAIRILDQGVDVVACDGVFVACPPNQLHAGSWRRLWQRLGRAMRVDPRNPHKVAHMLLWGDASHVDRMVRLVADTDAELGTRVAAMGVSYEQRRPQAEQAAAELLRAATVIGIERVWTTAEAVELFCLHAADRPPLQKKEIDVGGFFWKVGQWWNRVSGNFAGRTPPISLSVEQREHMRSACGWIDAWTADFAAKRAKKDKFYHPTTAEAVELFCLRAADGPPLRKKVVDVGGLFWKVGQWWNGVSGNFAGMTPRTSLSVEQREYMRGACGWIDAWTADLATKRARKDKFYQPTTAEAVELFCLHAVDRPPLQKKEIDVGGLFWKVGQWWDGVSGNFAGRTPRTSLSVEQREYMRSACGWIEAWAANFATKRAKKDKVYQPTTAEAVELFCLHAADGPPLRKKMVDVGGLPWKVGQWWANVSGNFAGRTPTTSLSVEQREHLRSACGWIDAWVADLAIKRDKKDKGYQPTTAEAVELFCLHAVDRPPLQKKEIDVGGLFWKVGQWWNRVSGNFAGRTPPMSLSVEQREHMRSACGWIDAWAAEIVANRAKKTIT